MMLISGQVLLLVVLIFCFPGIQTVAARALVPTASRQSQGGQCDGYELFYDHGTEMCELCSEICQFAHIQGTEEQCQSNCPQYLRAMECKQADGLYYDEVYDTCGSCCELCNKDLAPNPRCQQKCPDFWTHQDRTSEVPSGNPATMKLPPCGVKSGSGKKSFSSDDDAQTVWISAVIVIITVSIFIILVAFLIIRMSRSKPYTAVIQREREHDDGSVNCVCGERNRAETRPVEESRLTQVTESQSVTLLSTDGKTSRTVTLLAKTAFADLSVGHHASTGCDHA